MANFSELSGLKQWGIVLAGGALVTVALFFTVFKSQSEKNATAQHALDDKTKENNELESYRPKLKQIELQLAELKQELDIEARIVPDEKQIDQFITMVDAEAQKSGIFLRRYTAKDIKAQQYYTEVPFEVDIDGPYSGLLQFFDRLTKLDRIINVSGMMVSTVRTPAEAKVKHSYQYAPNESVVASFTATTFFTHDTLSQAPAAGAKPGTPAAK